MNHVIRAPDLSIADILRDDALRAFFTLKEALVHYRAIRHAPRRWAYMPVALDAMKAVADLDMDTKRRLFDLYGVVEKPASGKPRAGAGDYGIVGFAIAEIRLEWKDFDRHLGRAAAESLDSLKSAYRGAALMLHPDRNGDVGEMQALNAAFARLQEALVLASVLEDRPEAESGRGARPTGFQARSWLSDLMAFTPGTGAEFVLGLHTELIREAALLLAEDLYVDYAFDIDIGCLSGGTAPRYEMGSRDTGAVTAAINALTLARNALADLGRSEDARVLHDRAWAWLEAHINEESARQWGYEGYPFVKSMVRNLKAKATARTRQFQLNHVLKAEHALRRGLVTPEQYRAAMDRLRTEAASFDALDAEVKAWAAKPGFMRLEYDPVDVPDDLEARKAVNEMSVPGGGSGAMPFTAAACREYTETFYRAPSLHMLLKHGHARLFIILTSLIRTIGVGWSRERLTQARDEARLIGRLARETNAGFLTDSGDRVAHFIDVLLAEGDAFRERLRLLDGLVVVDVTSRAPRFFPEPGANAGNFTRRIEEAHAWMFDNELAGPNRDQPIGYILVQSANGYEVQSLPLRALNCSTMFLDPAGMPLNDLGEHAETGRLPQRT